MINGRTKAITIVDDIFSPKDCKEIIDYMQGASDDLIRRRAYPQLGFLPIVPHTTHNPLDEFVKSKMVKLFSNLGESVRIQRAHIETRENGSGLPFHFDEADASVVFTSVTYLNDDYLGGETIIRPNGEESDKFDTVVKPRTGRTVFFNGTYHWHTVSAVTNGTRYTLPTWYMLMPGDFPDKQKWWR